MTSFCVGTNKNTSDVISTQSIRFMKDQVQEHQNHTHNVALLRGNITQALAQINVSIKNLQRSYLDQQDMPGSPVSFFVLFFFFCCFGFYFILFLLTIAKSI
jgi:hypothetical protein